MKKVKVMNMMSFDIVKVPVKSIIDEVSDLINDNTTLERAEIIDKMLYSLEYTHPFAKIAIEKQDDELNDKIHASHALARVIEFTADKYVPLIQFNQDKLDEILALDRKVITDIERDDESSRNRTTTHEIDRLSVVEDEDQPHEESHLKKVNDTPNAGANPNLLDDTYLSQSERNTANVGLRESSQTASIDEDGSSTESDLTNSSMNEQSQSTTIDNIERAKILVQLDQTIKDYYSMWVREVDRAILVI